MTALTDFLLARIAEDEAVAKDALHPEALAPGAWMTEHHGSEFHSEPNRCHVAEDRSGYYWSVVDEVFIPVGEHIARWDPARVLAECRAKRQVVESVEVGCECHASGTTLGQTDWDVTILKALASTYSSHPDYDASWAQ